ncbi:Guanine deaminase [hydrothermal vent metagenome]|uniref:Guanine deaminase n=1 Tax=hydrothermal vent metagenome TaxID=652676 RepID=A0A3B0VUR0_9ZZZZ
MTRRTDSSLFMIEAINLADTGMKRGDGGPFGALVVKDGQVVGRGWNRVLVSNDPTAHAEIVAIRDACSRLDNYRLAGCHLYVNCEPCPMCLAAIYWARISSLTFGATQADAAAIGFDDERIYNEISLPVSARSLFTSQCRRDEALRVMRLWPTFAAGQSY